MFVKAQHTETIAQELSPKRSEVAVVDGINLTIGLAVSSETGAS